MRATSDDYYQVMLSLMPPGPAWGDADGELEAYAEEFARIHNRYLDLLEESDPQTAFETLAAHEKDWGLPDCCSAGLADTIEERRLTLIEKLTRTGGQSIPYFQSVCEALGYDVTFTEYEPFRCGVSSCGVDALHSEDARYDWTVHVLGPRITYFTCGQSRCGVDALYKISRAEDLECLLHHLKPDHTNLTVTYEGE